MRIMRLLALCAVLYDSSTYAADPAARTDAMKHSVEAPQNIKAELKDGSKIEIDPSGTVWVMDAAGAKTPAPDGLLTLKDGTPFVVTNGHIANAN